MTRKSTKKLNAADRYAKPGSFPFRFRDVGKFRRTIRQCFLSASFPRGHLPMTVGPTPNPRPVLPPVVLNVVLFPHSTVGVVMGQRTPRGATRVSDAFSSVRHFTAQGPSIIYSHTLIGE